MGEVYRADDLKLGQPVALKFLPEAVDRDPARLTQLHTEVRMARQVSHPNVCRVYDVGEFEGHTFLSMEYVDGEDLASLLRRIGRFPQDRAIELARQICAGLAAAHDRGVVHRDLKPANIMLDGSGRIRITDFGLAGATGETLRAGTPAYMAPEQLAGGEVTPRSDIYALGLVLYEIFTGQRALDAANLAELIAKREQAAITPPTDDRPRSRSGDRARDHALPASRIRRGGRPRRSRSRRRCPAAIRSRPRSPPAKRRRPRWSRPPARARRCRSRVVAGRRGVDRRLARSRCVLLYQRVLLINRVPSAEAARGARSIARRRSCRSSATAPRRVTPRPASRISLDWARYHRIDDPHERIAGELLRPRGRKPHPLVPHQPPPARTDRRRKPGRRPEPPADVGGMTLVVVDASGRLLNTN